MTDAKTALILGASRGIGLGLVEEYLARGWSVIATVRDAGAEAELTAMDRTGRLTVLRADVTHDGDIQALADRVDRPLDLLFLNAGIMGPEEMTTASPEEINQIMQTNAFGPARLAWALADRVRPRTGVIALMSTGMASIADNRSGGYDIYRASKAAQNMLARSLWVGPGQARGLTVLSVNPGWVKTAMGGRGATIDVPTSARGIADQIESHAGAGEHRFIGWNGRELPW
ncbi:SDR family NAD(P)-dependent oxidoreductase [Brevundimonas sp.]|uniref:SDR family NAD(P)-dependent oxidoreductase n=1 Tax=Brevundimonas sp. TaxID=1871086 RepID=UPI002D3F148A|nr:SDR family NAD(P)-dependent oxidoreductase [Brevundimonas sp.]HYC97658.1 SDR family NAD(P)-dependent oxidoreductase [Brevundimonas sp.]